MASRHMRTFNAVSIVLIAASMLAVTFVPVGCAAPYTATTVSSGNSISADYFTAGFYDSNGNPVSSVLTDSLTYTKTPSNDTSTYSIDDGTKVSVDNLYLRIDKGPHASGRTYSVSATCTCTFKTSESDAGTAATGATMNISLKDGETPVTTPTSDVLYGAELTVSNVSAVMAADPTLMAITFNISVIDNCTATYAGADSGISISGGSSPEIQEETEVANALAEDNTGIDDLHFAPASGSGTNSSGNSYVGGYGATISQGNTNAITGDGNGKLTSLHIDSESIPEYVLIVELVKHGSASTFTITMDGSSLNMRIDGKVYCVYMGNNSNLTSGEITKNSQGKYDITSFMSGKTWLAGNDLTFSNGGKPGLTIVDLVASGS